MCQPVAGLLRQRVDPICQPVGRHRLSWSHLSRSHRPLRTNTAEPRHPPGRLGRLQRLPLQRRHGVRLQPHPPQRHRLRGLWRCAAYARHGRRLRLAFHTSDASNPVLLQFLAPQRESHPRLLPRGARPQPRDGGADRHRAHRRSPLLFPTQREEGVRHRPAPPRQGVVGRV